MLGLLLCHRVFTIKLLSNLASSVSCWTGHWTGWCTHLIRGSKLGQSLPLPLPLSVTLTLAIVTVPLPVSVTLAFPLPLSVPIPVPFMMIIMTSAARLIAVDGSRWWSRNEAIAGGMVNNFESSEAQMVATLPGDDHRIGLDVLYGHFGY